MIILTTLSDLATFSFFLNNWRGEVVHIVFESFLCALRIHVYYFHPVLMCASACGFYSVCRGLADQRHQPMLKVLIPKPNKGYSKMASSLTWRKMSCEETWDESIPPPQRVCGSVWRGPVLYVFHLCCDRQ